MTDNEIKMRLFATYMGCEARFTFGMRKNELTTVTGRMLDTMQYHESDTLLLRSVSQLTDEEKQALKVILAQGSEDEELNDAVLWDFMEAFDGKNALEGITLEEYYPITSVHATDLLRSFGVAMPFMGISVQEQTDRGWITIRDE